MFDDSDKISLREKHLAIFLNVADDWLPKYLKPVEKLNGIDGFSVADYNSSPFSGFHPMSTRMVIKTGDYYLSNRADHHVLIFGWSEGL
jgi:hypothetical protein